MPYTRYEYSKRELLEILKVFLSFRMLYATIKLYYVRYLYDVDASSVEVLLPVRTKEANGKIEKYYKHL